MTTVVRSRGRAESFALLWTSLILGFTPVAAYYTLPGTRLPAVAFGAGIGLPFFLWALWRLQHMEALVLSDDGKSLTLFRKTLKGRTRLDIPTADVASIGLAGPEIGIALKSGHILRLQIDLPRYSETPLRDLAKQLGVRYHCIPLDD